MDKEHITQFDSPYFHNLESRHRERLSSSTGALPPWEQLLRNNPESAFCEAAIWEMLESYEILVEPLVPIPSKKKPKTPDFRCSRGDYVFYVDATCIMISTATKDTHLEHHNRKCSHYCLLTQRICNKIHEKTAQFANLENPCLVAAGTWHSTAAQCCFDKFGAEELLTGETKLSFPIRDEELDTDNVSHITELENSGFIRKSNSPIKYPLQNERKTVSGVLLCPFCLYPTKILGVLPPDPNHHFNREMLPEISFCTLEDGWQNGILKTKWI